ncbi:hypothetical protein J4734_19905 [Klebsiella pneumoniae]|uniref:Uncharacterized protein n=1 Tax=Klebsiella pneumoniae TaxID=573 RepID=A0A939SSK9_KLEPN|nr:hypothetical protein [Klebsiella pneumoniae]
MSRTQYQFTLQANLLEALSTRVPPLLSRSQAQPQLADVSSDWQDKGPPPISRWIATAPAARHLNGRCR